jgi:sporulation protein YlmC with PRC-barrel domain
MKRLTLKSTVAAIAITSAAAAWAQTDLNADAQANVTADTEATSTIDKALEDTGDALKNTANEVGNAVEDTSAAVAETAEETYDAATDTAQSAAEQTEAEVNAEATTQAQTGTANADASATAETEMVDGFSGMTVADVVGQRVIEANGEDVGTVNHVIENGGETEVVIGMGGFLGIGRHDVAVPLEQLTQGADGTLQLSGTTQEELKLMPEVDLNAVTTLSDDQSI